MDKAEYALEKALFKLVVPLVSREPNEEVRNASQSQKVVASSEEEIDVSLQKTKNVFQKTIETLIALYAGSFFSDGRKEIVAKEAANIIRRAFETLEKRIRMAEKSHKKSEAETEAEIRKIEVGIYAETIEALVALVKKEMNLAQ